MQVFTYVWFNISSGKRGEKVAAFVEERDFLRELDKWNGSQPGVWQYWRKPGSASRPITPEEQRYLDTWHSMPRIEE